MQLFDVLPKRLEKFGLEATPDKTRTLGFSRFHAGGAGRSPRG